MAITCNSQIDSIFDRKIESIVRDLKPDCKKNLQRISRKNALTIVEYIVSIQTEINLSDPYRRDLIILLCKFSRANNHKPFGQITRQEIIDFLDSFRRPEEADPLHKWVGTYNLYRIHFLRFFKWLYYPDIVPAIKVADIVPVIKVDSVSYIRINT